MHCMRNSRGLLVLVVWFLGFACLLALVSALVRSLLVISIS